MASTKLMTKCCAALLCTVGSLAGAEETHHSGSVQSVYDVSWNIGTASDSNPYAALTFDLHGPVTYTYDVTLPAASFQSYSISRSSLLASRGTIAGVVPFNIGVDWQSTQTQFSFAQQATFDTSFQFKWETFIGTLDVSPIDLPNFEMSGVSLTAKGGVALASSGTEMRQVAPVWSLSGNQLEFLAHANIPYVSVFAEALTDASFYLDTSVGIGVQESSAGSCAPSIVPFFGPTLDSLANSAVGTHTIDVTTLVDFQCQFLTDYNYLATAALTVGRDSDWLGIDPDTIYKADYGSWDVGTRSLRTGFSTWMTMPLTYTVVDDTNPSIPEPSMLSLFGLALLGARLASTRGNPNPEATVGRRLALTCS